MRTVLPNIEKPNVPVLPFRLLESSPRQRDATVAYSRQSDFKRSISGFLLSVALPGPDADAQGDDLRIPRMPDNRVRRDQNGAFNLVQTESGLSKTDAYF